VPFVSVTITVRIDEATDRRLKTFWRESGHEKFSQAVRACLMLGLNRGESLDAVWRRMTVTEGVRASSTKVRTALTQILMELDSTTPTEYDNIPNEFIDGE